MQLAVVLLSLVGATISIKPLHDLVYVGHVGQKYYFTKDARMAWAGCLDFCHQQYMDMETVENTEEALVLSNFLKSGALSSITFFYLGATDHGIEGEWKWTKTGERLSYLPWTAGHPATENERAWNCVAINSSGKFQNSNCSDVEPHRYVLGPLCEVKVPQYEGPPQ